MNENTEQMINGCDTIDKRYIARCIAELKRWGAPLSDWACTEIRDVREDDEDAPLSKCDLCGCTKVRYEHYMEHRDFPFPVVTGCVCAGIMEGDILNARERERQLKKRSKRRGAFIRRAWKRTVGGAYYRTYKKRGIWINEENGCFTVSVGSRTVTKYKGKRITDLMSAGYAAYDIIDPPGGIQS